MELDATTVPGASYIRNLYERKDRLLHVKLIKQEALVADDIQFETLQQEVCSIKSETLSTDDKLESAILNRLELSDQTLKRTSEMLQRDENIIIKEEMLHEDLDIKIEDETIQEPCVNDTFHQLPNHTCATPFICNICDYNFGAHTGDNAVVLEQFQTGDGNKVQTELQNMQREIVETMEQSCTVEKNIRYISQAEEPENWQEEENKEVEQQLTKKGNPRKRKKHTISKGERKKLKEASIRKNHKVLPPCSGDTCQKGCTLNISEERRLDINKQFWELNWLERRTFILNTISVVPVKKSIKGSKRKNTFNYTFKDESWIIQKVCKPFFLSTLGYKASNDWLVHHVLTTTSNGQLLPDRRGKHPFTKKINLAQIKEHTQTFTPSISHYTLKHAPNVRYLSSDINMKLTSKMLEKDKNIIIKEEMLHEELDIKIEDETIKEPCVDDKYNWGNQLPNHTCVKPFKCNICDCNFGAHTGDKSVGLEHFRTGDENKGQAEFQNMQREIVETTMDQCTLQKNIAHVGQAEEAVNMQQEDKNNNQETKEIEEQLTAKGNPRKRKKSTISKGERKKLKEDSIKKNHKVLPSCSRDTCQKGCTLNISEEQRFEINKQFWELNWLERRTFILNTVSMAPVKRSTKGSKRKNTFNYTFKDESGIIQKVCKPFFLSTLGYKATNDWLVHHVLTTTSNGQLVPDRRGKNPFIKKINPAQIKEQQETFNPSISHYNLKRAPNIRYLSSDINMKQTSKMLERDENIATKEEMLHEELDIKIEDEIIQEACVDDKYNSGNQLLNHTCVNPFKCNICDCNFGAHTGDNSVGLEHFRTGDDNKGQAEFQNMPSEIVETTMDQSCTVQKNIAHVGQAEEAVTMQQEDKNKNQVTKEIEEQLTKKGNPRKRKKPTISKCERKKLKEDSIKNNHKVLPSCSRDTCQKGCTLNISEEQRLEINKQFWELNWLERRIFILNTVSMAPVKRSTKGSKRKKTFNYTFKDESGIIQKVCKPFFLSTLGYKATNDWLVHHVLTTTSNGQLIPDRRGKHPFIKKINPAQIKEHPETFNPSISHYNLKRAPNIRYLSSDINMKQTSKMLERNENIVIKEEMLHEELDIKIEDEIIQEGCVDDKYNLGNQLLNHTCVNPFKCNICDCNFEAHTGDNSVGLEHLRNGHGSKVQAESQNMQREIVETTVEQSCTVQKNIRDVGQAEEARNIQQEDKNKNQVTKEIEEQLTKKGNPRKRKKPTISKCERKKLKEDSIKNNHKVLPSCSGETCQKGCTLNILEEQRLEINKQFWELNWLERRTFILNTVSVAPVKRSIKGSKRKKTFNYTFKDKSGIIQKVCKPFFLSTLGYKASNDWLVHHVLTTTSNNQLVPTPDRRGKHPSTKKIDPAQIKEHIESYNPCYHQEHAPNMRYLPSDINITLMHNDFKSKHPNFKCSYEVYRNVLKMMQINFTKLGHVQHSHRDAI